MTKIRLIANQDSSVNLHLIPIKGDEEITEVTIKELIDNSEYTHLRTNTANIKNAIAELNDILTSLPENQIGREVQYKILEPVDAKICVSIDDDEMSAIAEITAAQGGKHLSAKAILVAAQEAGVKKGFNKEALVKLAHLAAKAEPASTVSLTIAAGKTATHGQSAEIKPLVESAQTRILRPKKKEDGSVDMRDLGDIICVKVGDPLAEKIPLTQGKEGYTVTATPIPPEPGEDITLTSGEGTQVSKNNNNLLISTKVGLPKIIPNGMEVDEVYKIKNVTVATGNINFTGSVLIDGDVNEGMKVIASGDVTVGGFIESALIEAGGDVTISGGIIGHKHDTDKTQISDVKMSVNVNAKGNLYAKYCQYAQINCGNDIRIENQLLHSQVNVQGGLRVGSEDKSDGTLIGGVIKAGTHVSAGILGATAGSNTIVNFEHEVLKLQEKMDDIEARIAVEDDTTAELKAAIDKLKQLPKEKRNPEMLAKVVSTYQHHASLMGKIILEKEEHEKATQAYKESVYLEATEKMYQGVQLIVGEFNDRTRREYGPSRMVYKERKVHIEPLVNT